MTPTSPALLRSRPGCRPAPSRPPRKRRGACERLARSSAKSSADRVRAGSPEPASYSVSGTTSRARPSRTRVRTRHASSASSARIDRALFPRSTSSRIRPYAGSSGGGISALSVSGTRLGVTPGPVPASSRMRPSGSSSKRSRSRTPRLSGRMEGAGPAGSARPCDPPIALPVPSRKLVPDHRQLSSASATSAKVSMRCSGITPSSSTYARMPRSRTRSPRYRARRDVVERPHRTHDVDLAVAQISFPEADRRLHRDQAEQLQEMVLHHVLERSNGVVTAGSSLERNRLLPDDLDLCALLQIDPSTRLANRVPSTFCTMVIARK
jgi:hypothetical protein